MSRHRSPPCSLPLRSTPYPNEIDYYSPRFSRASSIVSRYRNSPEFQARNQEQRTVEGSIKHLTRKGATARSPISLSSSSSSPFYEASTFTSLDFLCVNSLARPEYFGYNSQTMDQDILEEPSPTPAPTPSALPNDTTNAPNIQSNAFLPSLSPDLFSFYREAIDPAMAGQSGLIDAMNFNSGVRVNRNAELEGINVKKVALTATSVWLAILLAEGIPLAEGDQDFFKRCFGITTAVLQHVLMLDPTSHPTLGVSYLSRYSCVSDEATLLLMTKDVFLERIREAGDYRDTGRNAYSVPMPGFGYPLRFHDYATGVNHAGITEVEGSVMVAPAIPIHLTTSASALLKWIWTCFPGTYFCGELPDGIRKARGEFFTCVGCGIFHEDESTTCCNKWNDKVQSCEPHYELLTEEGHQLWRRTEPEFDRMVQTNFREYQLAHPASIFLYSAVPLRIRAARAYLGLCLDCGLQHGPNRTPHTRCSFDQDEIRRNLRHDIIDWNNIRRSHAYRRRARAT